MIVFDILAALLAISALVFLGVALTRPEKF
ncbi:MULTISPECIES: potassium-transporting ATPase subunit F [Leucobacter]|nr:potassium-transporting ATPase subunit F [Leucobacter aridicollis]UTX52401.1 potassium-transporting ATPase subunit F [Leucobacter aridicollis]